MLLQRSIDRRQVERWAPLGRQSPNLPYIAPMQEHAIFNQQFGKEIPDTIVPFILLTVCFAISTIPAVLSSLSLSFLILSCSNFGRYPFFSRPDCNSFCFGLCPLWYYCILFSPLSSAILLTLTPASRQESLASLFKYLKLENCLMLRGSVFGCFLEPQNRRAEALSVGFSSASDTSQLADELQGRERVMVEG